METSRANSTGFILSDIDSASAARNVQNQTVAVEDINFD